MKLFTVLLVCLSALAFVLLFPLAATTCNGLCVDSCAMFIFGDSLLDAGTNNFIPNSNTTVSANSPPVKANFPPYGETSFHFPIGRFTNGRNIIDFIGIATPLLYAYFQIVSIIFILLITMLMFRFFLCSWSLEVGNTLPTTISGASCRVHQCH